MSHLSRRFDSVSLLSPPSPLFHFLQQTPLLNLKKKTYAQNSKKERGKVWNRRVSSSWTHSLLPRTMIRDAGIPPTSTCVRERDTTSNSVCVQCLPLHMPTHTHITFWRKAGKHVLCVCDQQEILLLLFPVVTSEEEGAVFAVSALIFHKDILLLLQFSLLLCLLFLCLSLLQTPPPPPPSPLPPTSRCSRSSTHTHTHRLAGLSNPGGDLLGSLSV